jgi:hypothetical protein
MTTEYDAIVVGARCAGSPTTRSPADFFAPEHRTDHYRQDRRA